MLSDTMGKRINRMPDRYVVFDLETTGTSTTTDRIVEISAVKVEKGNVVEEFSTLVDPGCPIPYYASMVNGITDDMVRGKPSIEEVLPDFLRFAGEHVLVGHNIGSFDMKYLYRDCSRTFGKTPDNDYVDTLYLARNLLPQLSHHRLVDLAEYYGISTRGAHRALNDCIMNQQVFEYLKEAMKSGEKDPRICPECGSFMKLRSGKFGEFWGCTGYPNCRHTEKAK